MIDFQLLQTMSAIHAPSGDEGPMRDFLEAYREENQGRWKVQPRVYTDEYIQNCLIWVFGNQPRTAVFAHLDSIGYTVRYGNELVKIGGPKAETGTKLIGKDGKGEAVVELVNDENGLSYQGNRELERGTSLTYHSKLVENESFIQGPYMDNRLGVWNALQQAKTMKEGILVFSCWEEHGSGSVAYLARILHTQFKIKQALISDITWVTDGVQHGKGVAISMRDRGIPPQQFVRKIIKEANASKIPFQLEVEDAGGSDGNILQTSPYPFDWCFIGAPEDHVHTPNETVHKADVKAMVELYGVLLDKL